jgi:hypothetical protein
MVTLVARWGISVVLIVRWGKVQREEKFKLNRVEDDRGILS